jgi:glycosyltransferase involved in cell wall biosynthesis
MKKDIICELEHEQYDLVHLEPFYVCPSMPEDVRCPMVVAEHNIEYEVYESYVKQFPISFLRPFLHRDVAKIKKQEEMVWKKAQSIITVSEHDASVIKSSVSKNKVAIIPNGVDTSYFSYEKKMFNKEHPRFLFVGNFYWVPNVKAVERLFGEIWPKVFGEIPHAHLTVVGKHLPQKLQEEAKALHIAYKEYVEDIRDAYKSSDILLAPMTISGGTKFKILEAMGSGCFVVTTKQGMEGIEVQNGIHYHEASLASEYVSAIQNVYDHPSKSQEMTAKARKVIENIYDWKLQAMKLSNVWEKII